MEGCVSSAWYGSCIFALLYTPILSCLTREASYGTRRNDNDSLWRRQQSGWHFAERFFDTSFSIMQTYWRRGEISLKRDTRRTICRDHLKPCNNLAKLSTQQLIGSKIASCRLLRSSSRHHPYVSIWQSSQTRLRFQVWKLTPAEKWRKHRRDF